MTVLEIQGLTVELGGRPVLDDVTTTVRSGELVGLVGPNGAGKTTLLRSVLGLVPRRAGTIHVDGRPVDRRRRAPGYVPQRHEFRWDYPIDVRHAVLTGRTGQLGVGRRPGVDDWRACLDAIARVQLGDLGDRVVGELSGGQRQRVLVARALARDPDVLLLDEPFTGLDLPTQELLSDLFRDLAAEGRALVVSTHDLVEAVDRCDRLLVLNRRVVADAHPSDLSDPTLWIEAFGVSPNSSLLRIIRSI